METRLFLYKILILFISLWSWKMLVCLIFRLPLKKKTQSDWKRPGKDSMRTEHVRCSFSFVFCLQCWFDFCLSSSVSNAAVCRQTFSTFFLFLKREFYSLINLQPKTSGAVRPDGDRWGRWSSVSSGLRLLLSLSCSSVVVVVSLGSLSC